MSFRSRTSMSSDEFWFYTITLGGLAFCSFVLFLVPVLRYDQLPIQLAFELWIAVVITSMGVWVAMSLVQNRLDEFLNQKW